MNSEYAQRLSLQELKQRNTQQTALPVQTPPPEARPTKADWERMMNDLDTLWYHADRQTDLLESVSRQMSQLPTRTQLDDLLKTVRYLEQMTEQAGKPKENSFSLHRNRKVLQKEREKKIALGHKADDHEDEVSYDWQQTM